MNFAKFLRTPFFIEHLQWLLLKAHSYLDFSSETDIQRSLKNCREVSEKWQNKFIKRVCLLLVSLLKGRQRLRLFPDDISNQIPIYFSTLYMFHSLVKTSFQNNYRQHFFFKTFKKKRKRKRHYFFIRTGKFCFILKYLNLMC